MNRPIPVTPATIHAFPMRDRAAPKIQPRSAKHAADLALLERIPRGPEKEAFRDLVETLARIESGRRRT